MVEGQDGLESGILSSADRAISYSILHERCLCVYILALAQR